MTHILTGVFLILHGLVHLLYYGQSSRRFELQPGLTWPDGSWVLSKLLGEKGTRRLAGVCCMITAAGFLFGGIATFFEQAWWSTAVIASAVFSGLMYILFWDGKLKHLDTQGGVGLIIDAAILVAILAFQWPQFNF